MEARSGRSTRHDLLVAVMCVALLVAVLVPLLLISRYNHSYADDWHYGVDAHLALVHGGGLFDVLGAAFAEVAHTWFTWQGTYSAILLMALQPGVFAESAYVFAAPFIMCVLIVATFDFFNEFLRRWMGANTAAWIAVSSMVCALTLLLQPSAIEGIFWYNSAIYYTFYHSLFLGLMARLMAIVRKSRAEVSTPALQLDSTPTPVGSIVCSVVLALVIAGGNFVTALVTVEIVAVFLLVFFSDRTATSAAIARRIVPAFAVLCLGLAVSFVAPGNAARQATQFPDAGVGVWGTIWKSSAAGFQYLSSWTSGLVVCGVLVVAPLVLRAAREKAPAWVRPQHPWLITFVSIAIFATSFTPTYWSMGNVGPGRVQNARFDFFLVAVVVNLCVWALWAGRSRGAHARPAAPLYAGARFSSASATGARAVAASDDVVTRIGTRFAASPAADVQATSDGTSAPYAGARFAATPSAASADSSSAYASDAAANTDPAADAAASARAMAAVRLAGSVLAMIVLVATIGSMATDETQRETLSSVSATRSLVTGQAAAYDEQVWDRWNMLATTDESDVEVYYYTDVPKVLYMGDVRDNMDNYINYRLAQWFEKDSIIGKHRPKE